MKLTKTDSRGRVWTYCDGEGSWRCGEHVIGCGGSNGSKWSVWSGPNQGYYEHKTLRAAMESCQ